MAWGEPPQSLTSAGAPICIVFVQFLGRRSNAGTPPEVRFQLDRPLFACAYIPAFKIHGERLAKNIKKHWQESSIHDLFLIPQFCPEGVGREQDWVSLDESESRLGPPSELLCSQSPQSQVATRSGRRKKTADKKGRVLESV